MDDRDKALQLIRMKGPIVPSNISKELGKNILFTSVILAELVSTKQLKMSTVKIGSSPLYYLPGQESRLELFYKYLNEKDLRTFELLKEKKVLREKNQDPLIKVSLTMIKDFAIPLDVTIKGEKELFYKWHTLTNEEAIDRIREIMSPKQEISTKVDEEIPVEKEPPKLPKEDKTEKNEPKKPEKKGKKEPEQKKLNEAPGHISEPGDEMFKTIKEFFDNNKIILESVETVRKGKEYECDIKILTTIGNLPYYCRFKDKKRVSDSDIASAFVQAQMKKLPLLFLTTGEPTKKLKEMLQKEFESVTFVRI